MDSEGAYESQTGFPLVSGFQATRLRAPRLTGKGRWVELPPPAMTGTQKETFRANWWEAANRMVLWIWLLMKFLAAKYYDQLRRRGSASRNAERLNQLLQSMGPTAVKIGQQLSVRVDLLPAVYCKELEKLLDAAPPFPTAEAIAIIEQETERPLSYHFQAFDPVPIGSASLACVFKAELHDGRPVAIKVRRPDVVKRLTADLKALRMVASALDLLGRVKVRPIIDEVTKMLLDELDFKLEAQHLLYFRRALKHQKRVSAPKVYYRICTRKILVLEFVTGVSMIEFLKRADSGDPADRAQLEREGFQCRKLARRLARFFYWELFDGVFFHADPHPGNIIIRPDNRVTLIDFGSCGSLPHKLREALLDFNLAIAQRDLEEATRCLRAMQEPLPALDYDAYQADMRSMVQKTFLELTNGKANWRERTVSVAFSESIAIARKYAIPLNIELLRYFRMVFLSDTILYRLNPRFNHIKETIAWYDKRRRRINRAMLRKPFDLSQIDLGKLCEAGKDIEHFVKQLRNRFEHAYLDFQRQLSKGAFAAKIAIEFIGRSVSLGVGFVVVRAAVWDVLHRSLSWPPLWEQFTWLASNRAYLFLVVAMAAHGLYRIHGRVQETDEEDEG